jgi:hypothetical protein
MFSDVQKLSGRTDLESNSCVTCLRVTCLWLAIFDLDIILWLFGQPALPFGGSRYRRRRWVIHWAWWLDEKY